MRTGSLTNSLMDDSTETEMAEVGMGCTLVGWTDRYAATVVWVSPSGHKIRVQRDRAIRTDGNRMSDAQSYCYERDSSGAVGEYTRRRDGTYRVTHGDARCLLGHREEYFDYSF